MSKKDFVVPVNPDVLRWARRSIEYAETYAAQELKLSQEEFDKLEAGQYLPSYELLLRMSKLYNRPLGALLLKQVPTENEVPKNFRTIASKGLGDLEDKTIRAIRRVRGLIDDALTLRKEMGLAMPAWNIYFTHQESATNAGTYMREWLRISDLKKIDNAEQALDTLVSRIEAAGILVFQVALTQEGIRGFSLTDEACPVIVIRRGGESATAKLFTLLHELGHITLKDSCICNLTDNGLPSSTETWCNDFAAAALVPMQELLATQIVIEYQHQGKFTWQDKTLQELGEIWHVGREAILRRLLTAGRTTHAFYLSRHRIWNKPQGGGRGGKTRDRIEEQVKEKGKTFTKIALQALQQNKISLKDFADYMDVHIEQVSLIPAYL